MISLASRQDARSSSVFPIPLHHRCANMDDRFPLMIKDWLRGEQLRAVLTAGETDHRKL